MIYSVVYVGKRILICLNKKSQSCDWLFLCDPAGILYIRVNALNFNKIYFNLKRWTSFWTPYQMILNERFSFVVN